MSESTTLYFIRHGETAWSISGQHTGFTDIALTAQGEEQARALAPYLGRIHFARVFSSPLTRARRTCDLAGLGDAAESEADLVEWNYGRLRRQTFGRHREGTARLERVGRRLSSRGHACHGSDRADRLLARLRAISGNIALFSHGQFGSALAARWIGLPLVHGQNLALSPATVSILSYPQHHPDTPVISLWNAAPATPGAAAS